MVFVNEKACTKILEKNILMYYNMKTKAKDTDWIVTCLKLHNKCFTNLLLKSSGLSKYMWWPALSIISSEQFL